MIHILQAIGPESELSGPFQLSSVKIDWVLWTWPRLTAKYVIDLANDIHNIGSNPISVDIGDLMDEGESRPAKRHMHDIKQILHPVDMIIVHIASSLWSN